MTSYEPGEPEYELGMALFLRAMGPSYKFQRCPKEVKAFWCGEAAVLLKHLAGRGFLVTHEDDIDGG